MLLKSTTKIRQFFKSTKFFCTFFCFSLFIVIYCCYSLYCVTIAGCLLRAKKRGATVAVPLNEIGSVRLVLLWTFLLSPTAENACYAVADTSCNVLNPLDCLLSAFPRFFLSVAFSAFCGSSALAGTCATFFLICWLGVSATIPAEQPPQTKSCHLKFPFFLG